MKGISILCRKELKEYFNSPLIYILSAMFCGLMGWLFFNYLTASSHRTLTTMSLTESVLIPTFGNMNFIFLFLAPLLTMKMFAEENKSKTLDLLLMSDLRLTDLVLAKFLAAFLSAVFMLSTTFIFPLVLAWSGYTDWGTVITSYLGICFSLACYLSVGLFASSLTENQIVAAMISFCILLGIMLLVITAQATHNEIVSMIFQYMSTPFHFESFTRGSVRSYSLVYGACFLCFFFYATYLSLDSRRW
jgi:ABC-2 type transport system permease protein